MNNFTNLQVSIKNHFFFLKRNQRVSRKNIFLSLKDNYYLKQNNDLLWSLWPVYGYLHYCSRYVLCSKLCKYTKEYKE